MESQLYRNVSGEAEVIKEIIANYESRFTPIGEKLKNIQRIYIVGSGTSYHAGLAAKHTMEKLTGIEVIAAYPTHLKQMNFFAEAPALCIGISQGGISAVTIECVKRFKQLNYNIITITAHPERPLAAEGDFLVPLNVGEERSASTKGYIASIINLYFIALAVGYAKGVVNEVEKKEFIGNIENHANNFKALFDASEHWVKRNMNEFCKATNISVMGYENNYSTAMEGALKLLEAVRTLTVGYEFEEWLHGGYNALTQESNLILLRSKLGSSNAERIEKLTKITKDYTDKVYVINGFEPENPKHLNANFSGVDYLEPLEYIIPLQMIIALIPGEKGINADQVLIPGFHQMIGSKV